ncbi:hypothetical protein CAOG_03417 [Capsaspora owczarzaki ATCC 30864]|uniref:hypothetical protein n=1 Tax=Capsaspora owczarzaki (strain ATCC 30864) TaxID=595528 RepID=UPI0001FE53FB|nr:hypothetical protein CAOG_03417 [Capsaspora owczarzaki ATCC 30864]|eukprot:XP_004364256.1 hypothetical protein CAOG_03417 [Capsaspora owczarzaki ATCC 30864]
MESHSTAIANADAAAAAAAAADTEVVDVVVVGGGISGLTAAWHVLSLTATPDSPSANATATLAAAAAAAPASTLSGGAAPSSSAPSSASDAAGSSTSSTSSISPSASASASASSASGSTIVPIAAPASVLVLEANSRVGGRTFTAVLPPFAESAAASSTDHSSTATATGASTVVSSWTHVGDGPAAANIPNPSPLMRDLAAARTTVPSFAAAAKQSELGLYIDLGGQWIGPTQRAICHLVDLLGLKKHEQYHAGRKVLDLSGVRSTYSADIPVGVGLFGLLDAQLALWRLDRMVAQVPLDNPLNCPNAKRWDSETVASVVERITYLESTRRMLRMLTQVVFGTEPSEITLLNFLWYARCAGGIDTLLKIEHGLQQWTVVGGTQQISEALMAKVSSDFGSRGRVQTSSRVVGIEQDVANGSIVVRYVQQRGAGKAQQARQVRARRVIVATPPAVANRMLFEPPLPQTRQWLMQRSFIGSQTKFIAFFQTRFWLNDGLSGEALSDSLCVCFDDSLPRSDGTLQPALVVFAGGDLARQWSLLTAQERSDRVVARLRRWFGSRVDTELHGVIEKEWGSDPFAIGCPAGLWSTGSLWSAGATLREPCGRIHWAGTETAHELQGFMDGAVRAGLRAADEVVGALAGVERSRTALSAIAGARVNNAYDLRQLRSETRIDSDGARSGSTWFSWGATLLVAGALVAGGVRLARAHGLSVMSCH